MGKQNCFYTVQEKKKKCGFSSIFALKQTKEQITFQVQP